MIFKKGDVIEYPNGLDCVVKYVDENDFIHMFTFDGTIEVMRKGVLLRGIASGRIKFKNYGRDLQPIKYVRPNQL